MGHLAFLVLGGLGVLSLVWWWLEKPPGRPEDICSIFGEKRAWHDSARRAAADWGVPEPVLMALIYQESSFRARARPPRRRILWIIPWRRPTSAYGYSQALDSTWQEFRQRTGRPDAERHRFDDAAQFIGWYGEEIHRLTGVARDDAYRLYLAYHEGPGGYGRGSYRQKAWLMETARKVEARAERYRRQYGDCGARLGWWWRWRWPAIVLLVAAAGWLALRLRR